jgi:hypothetical protein
MKTASHQDLQRSRPIESFHGYRITDDGIVISCRRPGPPIIKRPEHRGRYDFVGLINADGIQENESVHSLVLITFGSPRPSPQHQTRHLNGNSRDNRISNLAWGLPIDNAADRRRHGRYVTDHRGEIHGMAKLNDLAVFRIIERLSAGEQQQHIATTFGVSPSTIGKIARGERWTHVTQGFRNHIEHLEHQEAA